MVWGGGGNANAAGKTFFLKKQQCFSEAGFTTSTTDFGVAPKLF